MAVVAVSREYSLRTVSPGAMSAVRRGRAGCRWVLCRSVGVAGGLEEDGEVRHLHGALGGHGGQLTAQEGQGLVREAVGLVGVPGVHLPPHDALVGQAGGGERGRPQPARATVSM